MVKDSNKSRFHRGCSTESAQRGVSLIITFFIMIIILAVAMSVSSLLYAEIKVIRNISNSMVSFYAADSGIEKVLFYDRQIMPEGAVRGLCSILDNCGSSPALDPSGDYSIYCNINPEFPFPMHGDAIDGCDPDKCNDCSVYFDTTFDGRVYRVKAEVNPFFYSDITSIGFFGGASRKIEIVAPWSQQ